MGLESVVAGACELAEALARLTALGVTWTIVMVDGALVMPGMKVPERWVDVSVKTDAGTFAIKRRSDDSVAVIAFGNADENAKQMQDRIAAALRGE